MKPKQIALKVLLLACGHTSCVPQGSVTDPCLSRSGRACALMFAEIRENHLG